MLCINLSSRIVSSSLERKSVNLKHMFIDCFEVEDNLRISKIIAEWDSVNEMDKELELVEKHE